MDRRIPIVGVIVLVAMAAAGPAAAKIMGDLHVQGPGLAAPIAIDGSDTGELWRTSRFMTGAPAAGRPAGDLGPRYRATLIVKQPEPVTRITLHLYPYAERSPVLFTPAGQRWPWGDVVPTGWTEALPGLKALLVRHGLPAVAPEVVVPGGGTGLALPAPAVAAIGLALLAATVALGLAARRRHGATVA